MWRASRISVLLLVVALVSACSSGGRKPSPPPAPMVIPLIWMPSVEDEDNQPIEDLTAYRVEYARAESTSQFAQVNLPPSLTRYNLVVSPGKWHIRIVAVSASRGESDPSNLLEVAR